MSSVPTTAKESSASFSKYHPQATAAMAAPSLKSSVTLSMLRSQPPLRNLPPFSFGDNSSVGSYKSNTSSSTCQTNQKRPQQVDDDNSVISGSTCYHDEGEAYLDEANNLSKLITLQSIDRLEHHLPHIVVDHIIADMTQRKEEAAQEKQHPMARGSITVEVPMDVNMTLGGNGGSSATSGGPAGADNNTTTTGASTARSHEQQRGQSSSAKSVGSSGGMSDLLNTLSSLDELLEEEFSSSEDDDTSSDDGSSSYHGSSDEYGSSSSSDDGEDNESDMDASAITFDGIDDNDGVSDIGDDGISDIGDSDHPDDLDDDDDDHDESQAQQQQQESCARAALRRRRPPGRSTSFDSARSSIVSTGTLTSGGSGSRSRSRTGSLLSGGRVSSVGAGGPGGRTNGGELGVGKLRQGRLNNRRLESDAVSDDRSMSVDLTTLSTKSEQGAQSLSTDVQSSEHQSAILFVDISGFTKLSRSLEVEALSEIINSYFQMIVDEIKACGGDILKFAGDALIVEWTQEMLPEGQKHLNVTLLAALCGSQLVDKCSDYPVDRDGQHICTLNLHCALGYGDVVGAHCGDMDRMEYLILGDSIKQIADAMDFAKLGEVVASPQAMASLSDSVSFTDSYKEGEHHMLAFKNDKKFQANSSFKIPYGARVPISEQCKDWPAQELDNLQRRMSRYVHGVVYADEFSREESMALSNQQRMSMARASNVKCQQTQSELRDVFTVFIQPKISHDLNGDAAGDDETLQLLNSIMFIVNTEVTHHKAHLRQFIVDDKGLVVIANFGLRGSTFPNMIEERAIPCISNIRTLLMTELDLECSIGATYGKAYCGVVGGRKRHEYAILGPSVNLAARLMANACNPGILVDEEVKKMAGDRPFKSLAPVKAKGYDDLVKIYNPDENVRKAWKDVSDEFVGRQEEVNSLMQTAESVIHDAFASKVVFVSGPYGIGKSYVLSHAAKEIESYCNMNETPKHVSRLIFCEDDSFRPFSIVRPLFLDLLRRKAHIPSFGAAETAGHTENISQKAEIEEAQLYVSLLQICLEAKIPMQYIEMFGGLIFSTKLSDIGTWSDRSRKMSEWNAIARHLVTAFIHCTAEYGVVLLALDGVSGMDEMSWKILQRLYERASNLMVVGTARNEFDLNINAEFWADLNEEGIDSGRFRHLRMAPMMLKDVSTLACKRLGKSASDLDTICKTVNCQSRGNPLLACEILDAMYKDTDASEPAVSGAALSKIEELLLNRLDELSPVDRSHLNLGAILGFSFDEGDIVAVMVKYNDVIEDDKDSHARMVRSSLQESVEYGVLKCTFYRGKITYEFAHALWMKTITLHILDSWKDEMRALIGVASTEGEISVKYDWDELATIRANLSSMRQQNHGIQQSIDELRALINRAR